jgi:hypothetical protein
MSRDFDALKSLQRHSVPFVVVGGHAVNVHGFRRVTDDVDVVWMRSRDSEEKLLNALVEMDAQYIGDEIDPATGIERTHAVTRSFLQTSHLMMLDTVHGFVDFFDYVPGLPAEDPRQLLDSAIDVDGVKYVSLEWLRKMKQASGRTKDMLDLEKLPEA